LCFAIKFSRQFQRPLTSQQLIEPKFSRTGRAKGPNSEDIHNQRRMKGLVVRATLKRLATVFAGGIPASHAWDKFRGSAAFVLV